MSLPPIFPKLNTINEYKNPAIRLFGNRFFIDQTVLELLAEFLAVVYSEKNIGKDMDKIFYQPLPPLNELQRWFRSTDYKLYYKPSVKLNLKLFSLFCTSPLDKRHQIHEVQLRTLRRVLDGKIVSSNRKNEEVRECLEDLFMGFQGAGSERTWCAKTFYPLTPTFITQETLWNETVARKEEELDWYESINDFPKYFGKTKHIFLSRGGELLYLQLCNLFASEDRGIASFAENVGIGTQEKDLYYLYNSLNKGFEGLDDALFAPLNKLADFIENLDPETHETTNRKEEGMTCDWCPEESWQEAFLYAIELNRVLNTSLDPVERLELLQMGCVLQVMRSLCAQSVRYADVPLPKGRGGALGYAWIFSHTDRKQKLISRRNLQFNLRLIQRAIHNEDLINDTVTERDIGRAENKHGHKFFRTIGKRQGIIGPWRGAEPRFSMTDRLIRYLILALLPPEESCQYKDFLKRLYRHFGIAIEGEELADAVLWSGLPNNCSLNEDRRNWFTEMLRAGGFLTELSDNCSIVRNPFSKRNNEMAGDDYEIYG
jgi:hypothetical protein